MTDPQLQESITVWLRSRFWRSTWRACDGCGRHGCRKASCDARYKDRGPRFYCNTDCRPIATSLQFDIDQNIDEAIYGFSAVDADGRRIAPKTISATFDVDYEDPYARARLGEWPVYGEIKGGPLDGIEVEGRGDVE